MAYEWLKTGVQVICTNATPLPGYSTLDMPKKGGRYVVSQVVWHRWALGDEGVGVYLAGVSRDAPYGAFRFRPLITKTQEQDVEMFLRLAGPSPLERLDRLAEELDSLYND